ncbi:hypothetical protein [Marinobacter sp. X15-166B]|uniref:hypothetical protein n=1 Tax=Marinobacter sp. X15-166B TaxID=1897620 RepID=UPI00085BCA26|nr:hypothetical protein [Marinobacter sp. X15-166B]OEY66058.1 hypothetical protein BG841_06025 [Marinobacter sp. X15-166B]
MASRQAPANNGRGPHYLRTEVEQSFSNTISDTDLIIGTRSGQLNLLLYTVFHIGDATNNLRWPTFQALQKDKRIDWLIPISRGDSYKGYRVVATEQAFIAHFRYGRGEPLNLAGGRTSISNHTDTPVTVTGILEATGTPVYPPELLGCSGGHVTITAGCCYARRPPR